MATVRYTNIEGQIVAEKRSGTRFTYVPDVQGSTIARSDSAQNVIDTAEYWPYGEPSSPLLQVTGFYYVGTWGYRSRGGLAYVRARWLGLGRGSWLTLDPLGFNSGDLNLYSYVSSGPTSAVDPSGEGAPTRGTTNLGIPNDALYNAASKIAQGWLKKGPCGRAFAKICSKKGTSFAKETKTYMFAYDTDRCHSEIGGNPTSSCGVLVNTGPGTGRPCAVGYLCFTDRVRQPKPARTQRLACLLLLEILNACNCTYHNSKDEKRTQRVLNICGVSPKYCGSGAK
jgi:RHS repeat-associated protein